MKVLTWLLWIYLFLTASLVFGVSQAGNVPDETQDDSPSPSITEVPDLVAEYSYIVGKELVLCKAQDDNVSDLVIRLIHSNFQLKVCHPLTGSFVLGNLSLLNTFRIGKSLISLSYD